MYIVKKFISYFFSTFSLFLLQPDGGCAEIPKKTSNSSVFIVGVYQSTDQLGPGFQNPCTTPKVIDVNVGLVSKPITLVLSSYECALWNINAYSEANIYRIIVNGYYKDSVFGVPTVPVTNYYYAEQDGTFIGSFLATFPFNRRGPLNSSSNFCRSFPRDIDCRMSQLDQFLRALNKKEEITSYNSFIGKYWETSFDIGRDPDNQNSFPSP